MKITKAWVWTSWGALTVSTLVLQFTDGTALWVNAGVASFLFLVTAVLMVLQTRQFKKDQLARSIGHAARLIATLPPAAQQEVYDHLAQIGSPYAKREVQQ